MSSDLKIETNRQNSQHSTGPRTDAGKAISSRNHLQSGIYSQSEVIRDENPADLQALTAEYHDRFQPDRPELRFLVDTLVRSEWILRRLARAEAQLWEKYIVDTQSSFHENLHDLGRAVNCGDSKVLARLQVRVNATHRNYERSLKELMRLGPEPAAAVPQPEPAPEPKPVAMETAIGFVPPASGIAETAVPPTPAAFGFESSTHCIPDTYVLPALTACTPPSVRRPAEQCSS
jgi:hypothetical protein